MSGATYAEALAFALEAHGDQRYGDRPYVAHLVDVWRETARLGGDHHQQVAAILHDVVEDTETIPADVEAWFGADVAGMVSLLTKRDGQSRREYLAAIVDAPRAALVKLADSTCNQRRLADITDGARRRRLAARYAENITLLEPVVSP